MLLALPVSIYEVAMQLEYFSRPKLQIRVIRILWMVPVYALDSWFALRFKVRIALLRCTPCEGNSIKNSLYPIGRSTSLCCGRSRLLHMPQSSMEGKRRLIVPLLPGAQQAQIYLDTARECYEAFVIYNFFMYLLAYLEEVCPYIMPFCCLPERHRTSSKAKTQPI